MSEYVAKGGTTALGIIGTVLGSIGTAASGALGVGKLTGGSSMNDTERCKDMMMRLSEQDAKVARLEGEKYTDNNILKLYEYLDGRLRGIEKQVNDNAAAQAVINCQANSAIQLLNQNIAAINNTLALITKTAVPKSIVVDFTATTTATS